MNGKVKTLNLDSGTYEIKKMPLGRFVDLFKVIGELPKELSQWEGKTNEDIFKSLPSLLVSATPQLISAISVASNIPEEKLKDEMGLDDLTQILMAILEVNNFEEIKKNFKSLLQSTKAKKVENPNTGLKK